MAVTGPFSRVVKNPLASPRTYYKFTEWYRQSKPYVLRLPFHMEVKYAPYNSRGGPLRDMESAFSGRWYGPTLVPFNKAYDKFKSKVGGTSSWGENVATYRESLNAINKRSVQMLTFMEALVTHRFGDAAEALGLKLADPSKRYNELRMRAKAIRNRDQRLSFLREQKLGLRLYYKANPKVVDPSRLTKSAKGLASNFLEFHLGWEPLIKDIYDATQLLQGDIPYGIIRGTGSAITYVKSDRSYFETETYRVLTKCQIIADVAVVNPNLHLADSLGIINPATLAFQVIPLSFVLGWFIPVERFLNQFTDFLGCSIQNAAVTYSWDLTYQWERKPPATPEVTGYRSYEVTRTQGIPAVPFKIPPFRGFSPVRGATALSLVVQLMAS